MVIQVIYVSNCDLIAYDWYQDASGNWIQGGTLNPTWDCSNGSRLNDVINWVVARANIIKENVYTTYKTQLNQAYTAAGIKYIEVGEITNHRTVYTAGCSLSISPDKTFPVTPGEYVTFTIQQNPPITGKVVQLELKMPNGSYIYKGSCSIDSTGKCTVQWMAESGYGAQLYFRANITSDACISPDVLIKVNITPPTTQPPTTQPPTQPPTARIIIRSPTTHGKLEEYNESMILQGTTNLNTLTFLKNYPVGSYIIFKAVPDNGYKFVKWVDETTGNVMLYDTFGQRVQVNTTIAVYFEPVSTQPPTTQPPTSQPPTTQPPQEVCDPDTEISIPSLGCVPKNYLIYGGLGFALLMLLKK